MAKSSNILPEFYPVLGRLEHDEERNSYSGKLSTRQQKVAIQIEADDQGNFASSEARAIRFARDPRLEFDSVKRYLAGSFLDVANQDWAEPDNDPLSAGEFMERITVEDVVFEGDGGVEFYFADGDIFGGHGLIARMRPDGILFDSELAG